jgi:hypothetical protein
MTRPIATCTRTSCDECSLQGRIHCHFSLQDLAKFMMAVLPSFLFGIWGMLRMDDRMLLPWVALCLGFFGVAEVRVLCSHCPHYAEPGRFLRCWANHGSPKLWAYRPGLMTFWERLILLGGFGFIWSYPLTILVLGKEWLLMTAFVLSSAGCFVILKRAFCTRCMNFACPLNGVSEATRQEFDAQNVYVL